MKCEIFYISKKLKRFARDLNDASKKPVSNLSVEIWRFGNTFQTGKKLFHALELPFSQSKKRAFPSQHNTNTQQA